MIIYDIPFHNVDSLEKVINSVSFIDYRAHSHDIHMLFQNHEGNFTSFLIMLIFVVSQKYRLEIQILEKNSEYLREDLLVSVNY